MSGEETGPGARPVVAHLHHAFFAKTETFIYHAITNLRRFRPICLAWEYRNLDSFPLPASDCFRLGRPRFTPAWIVGGFARRLAGRELRGDAIVRRERVRLVHAHFGPGGVLALRLRRPAGVPLATTFYGSDVSLPIREPAWQARYRELFATGEKFFVEGPYMQRSLCALGCPADKVAVQRIAIPVSSYAFRARAPKTAGEKVIVVFAGRLVEKKGVPFALEAMREVAARFPRCELRVIGDGPQRTQVEELVVRWRLQRAVRLLGFVSYRDYVAELERADIFLHPSVTAADGDSEGGAPTSILEAQALGLPVVASRHADIPNVVAEGESALLSAERDVGGLAGHLAQLVEDQRRWAAMGAAGRRFVEAHHDVRLEIPLLESRYAGLIGLDA